MEEAEDADRFTKSILRKPRILPDNNLDTPDSIEECDDEDILLIPTGGESPRQAMDKAHHEANATMLLHNPKRTYRRKAKKPNHLRLTLVPTTSNKELSPKKEDKPRPPPPSPKKNLSDLRLLQKKSSEFERPKPIPAKPKDLDPSFDIDESLTDIQTNKKTAQETDSLEEIFEAESPPVARAKPAPKPKAAKRPTPKAREARTPNRYTQRAAAADPIIIISDEEEGDTELGSLSLSQSSLDIPQSQLGENPKFRIFEVTLGTHASKLPVEGEKNILEFHKSLLQFYILSPKSADEVIPVTIRYEDLAGFWVRLTPQQSTLVIRLKQNRTDPPFAECYDTSYPHKQHIIFTTIGDKKEIRTQLKHIKERQFESLPKLAKISTEALLAMLGESGQRQTRSMTKRNSFYSSHGLKKVISFDAITLTQEDVDRLEPGELLNDNIIEFYLKYLQKKGGLDEAFVQKCYFYNTFFWPKLCSSSSRQQPHKVLSWTKNVDIFRRQFLFIPINDGFHWNVMVICNPGMVQSVKKKGSWEKIGKDQRPIMLHLCSMHLVKPHVFKQLRKYLAMEWKERHPKIPCDFSNTTLPGLGPKVPVQENGYDCGVFLLQYVESFCRSPPNNFDKDYLKDVWFTPEWFDASEIPKKRAEIKGFIERLQAEQDAPEEKSDNENEKCNGEEKEKDDNPPLVTADNKDARDTRKRKLQQQLITNTGIESKRQRMDRNGTASGAVKGREQSIDQMSIDEKKGTSDEEVSDEAVEEEGEDKEELVTQVFKHASRDQEEQEENREEKEGIDVSDWNAIADEIQEEEKLLLDDRDVSSSTEEVGEGDEEREEEEEEEKQKKSRKGEVEEEEDEVVAIPVKVEPPPRHCNNNHAVRRFVSSKPRHQREQNSTPTTLILVPSGEHELPITIVGKEEIE